MIHHGDLFTVLPTLDANSVDACVTDPPYGIGFMGREWDTFKPEKAKAMKKHAITVGAKGRRDLNPNTRGRRQSPAMSPSQIEYDYTANGLRGFQDWTAKWSAEVFRVLKPGAYIVVCGAPRSHHRMMCGLEDAGFVVRDCFAWLFGSGFPKNKNLGQGRGTALKPAHEPIALAWKPFKGSISGHVAQFGTGALNIDACRIGADDERPTYGPHARRESGAEFAEGAAYDGGLTTLGRWPANVLLDADSAALLDAQTAHMRASLPSNTGGGFKATGAFPIHNAAPVAYEDAGGASRFYYVAKPSREERDYGTHGLTQQQRDESRKEGNPGGDNPRNRGLQPRGNFHPTVKPVELMRWLVKLVTPPNGTVLDPFLGSGTTGMACRYESRPFIGIEREAEYVTIAERRISAVAPLFSAQEIA